MLKNSKLSYIVPGYTGHIPRSHIEKTPEIDIEDPHGHIPGYVGYISSVKPENIFGETYGNITYKINCLPYHQGQDVDAEQRYSSISRKTFIDQSTIRQRTAAEVVGIKKPQNQYIKQLEESMPFDHSQPMDGLMTNNCQEMELKKSTFRDSAQEFFGKPQESKYLKFEDPIPGYTGHGRRVASDNIYGATFANSRKKADESLNRINEMRKSNLMQMSSMVPPVSK